MAKAEQTRGTFHSGTRAKQYEKRKAARIRRRMERKDPENAPTRLRHVIKGWVD